MGSSQSDVFIHIFSILDGDFESFISLFGFWCCMEHTQPNKRTQFGGRGITCYSGGRCNWSQSLVLSCVLHRIKLFSELWFWWPIIYCSVAKSCLTFCNPMDCSMLGFPVLHYLQEFAQIHISVESVMPSNHLILCHPLLLLPYEACPSQDLQGRS